MNGVHDMGGMDGFGKVEVEANEPTFHHSWEGRVMAMVRAMGANGNLNIDMQRFSRESIAPAVSLSVVYLPAVLVIAAYWGLGLGLLTSLASAAATPGAARKMGAAPGPALAEMCRRAASPAAWGPASNSC